MESKSFLIPQIPNSSKTLSPCHPSVPPAKICRLASSQSMALALIRSTHGRAKLQQSRQTQVAYSAFTCSEISCGPTFQKPEFWPLPTTPIGLSMPQLRQLSRLAINYWSS
jgi:hypothetical protein